MLNGIKGERPHENGSRTGWTDADPDPECEKEWISGIRLGQILCFRFSMKPDIRPARYPEKSVLGFILGDNYGILYFFPTDLSIFSFTAL